MKYLSIILIFLITSCFNSKDSKAVNIYTEEIILNMNTLDSKEDITYYDLNDLSYFSNKNLIKSLTLRGGTFTDLDPLSGMFNLEELDIGLNYNIFDLSPLRTLVNLRKLSLSSMRIESIEPISSLVNLKYLELFYRDKYYKELVPLKNLEVLRLHNGTAQDLDVTYIAQLQLLKELMISVRPIIYNIELLANLTNLEKLEIHFPNFIDLSWIPNLQKLTYLELRDCKIKDVTPLLELPLLTELYLPSTTVYNIDPLLESKSIKQIIGPILINMNPDVYEKFSELGIDFIPFSGR